jgi:hypothetical protein
VTTSQNHSPVTDEKDQKPDVAQLQADIERTREDLAQTVDALTDRLDVKSRARRRVAETRERAAVRVDSAKLRTREITARAKQGATDADGKPTPTFLAGGGVTVAALVAVGVLSWNRSRR